MRALCVYIFQTGKLFIMLLTHEMPGQTRHSTADSITVEARNMVLNETQEKSIFKRTYIFILSTVQYLPSSFSP